MKNAYEIYEILLGMNPYSQVDLLHTHKILMKELTTEAGMYRSKAVGIFAGEQLVHMAPPAERVPELMKSLLDWTPKSSAHPLIKSSVFH